MICFMYIDLSSRVESQFAIQIRPAAAWRNTQYILPIGRVSVCVCVYF